ncbi:hypothetical protein [Hymenobacter psychrophilus]|uniref:Rubredoxin-like domain-containing protein n=1 Tax=Hymenobacter psychrophilus TaxID=651662 RepID=A0A1H3FWI1_9BACT|nr:hypothetical protein [Hymenobacter psychrophilus]SDX95175.1 hypothetical protein SAMN04488069_104247 [Hymenobacter psychrophilus]
MPLWFCRVCGLDYDESPWGPDGHTPDHTLCGCCGAEFGYHDATPTAARQYRAQWLAAGAGLFYPNLAPANWQLAEQLAQIPVAYQ